MSSLSQVLSEYSVPLQIWLSPEARTQVAEILITEMGDKAQIIPEPLAQAAQLRGPAVLVITAKEMTGTDQVALRALAEQAHPGRAVLLGGTSDRDTLMDAINNWGVVRVVATNAEREAIVETVRAAGVYLNREVAMETAIDDLDIETTMIDSAIDQLEHSQDRTRTVDRTTSTTTFTAGMIQIIERERAAVSSLLSTVANQDHTVIQQTLLGMNALANITEKAHDYAIENAAGMPPGGEDLDPLIQSIGALLKPNLAGHLGSGIRCTLDPFVLSDVILSICRKTPPSELFGIDTHKAGAEAVITMSFGSPIPEEDLIDTNGQSWKTLHEAGGRLHRSSDGMSVALNLPIQDTEHA